MTTEKMREYKREYSAKHRDYLNEMSIEAQRREALESIANIEKVNGGVIITDKKGDKYFIKDSGGN